MRGRIWNVEIAPRAAGIFDDSDRGATMASFPLATSGTFSFAAAGLRARASSSVPPPPSYASPPLLQPPAPTLLTPEATRLEPYPVVTPSVELSRASLESPFALPSPTMAAFPLTDLALGHLGPVQASMETARQTETLVSARAEANRAIQRYDGLSANELQTCLAQDTMVAAAHGGGRSWRPTASEWHASPSLRERHFLCPRCNTTTPKDVHNCNSCSVALVELRSTQGTHELSAVISNAHRTAYGRNLGLLMDRAPVHSNGGGAVVPGAPGYSAWVRGQLSAFSSRPSEMRTETKPPTVVCIFDGWLCLHTEARIRFYTREHVRAFMQGGDSNAEDLLTDFISDAGKVIDVPWSEKPVLVQPKGGWWLAALTHVSEHDLRIARVALGFAFDSTADGRSVQQKVLQDRIEPATSHLVTALTCSV